MVVLAALVAIAVLPVLAATRMALLGLVIVGIAVLLIVRRAEVRLVLLGAGLAMAVVAGQPLAVFDAFTFGMVTATVAPICAAMGFAAVLSATQCDRHLVHLLVLPLRRFRWLLVPGGILAAFIVNTSVTSMTSTAAALGPILIPLMLASGVRPEIAAAALVLGSSSGGDLLNPGAQDVQAIAQTVGIPAKEISARVVPASITGVLVGAAVFTLLNRRRGAPDQVPAAPAPASTEDEPFRLNYFKASIPLFPVALLLLAYFLQPRMGADSPLAWLLDLPRQDAHEWRRLQGALPVVRAMLIGTLLAGLVGWRDIQLLARSLFEGMGTGYTNIISLTITANCFGAGIGVIGLSQALLGLVGLAPLLAPLFAATIPWVLAVLSGSGSGSILAFAQSFLSRMGAQYDVPALSAIACLGGAYGRTMSPVAAVVVYSAGLVGLLPFIVVRKLLPAALAGALGALATVMLMGFAK